MMRMDSHHSPNRPGSFSTLDTTRAPWAGGLEYDPGGKGGVGRLVMEDVIIKRPIRTLGKYGDFKTF